MSTDEQRHVELATPGWIRALAAISVLVALGTLLVCTPIMALSEGQRGVTYFYGHAKTSFDALADVILTLTSCAGVVVAPFVAVVAVLIARGRALRLARFVALAWTAHVGVVATGFCLRAAGELTSHHFHAAVSTSDWAPFVALAVLLFGLAGLHSYALWRAAKTMLGRASGHANSSSITRVPGGR